MSIESLKQKARKAEQNEDWRKALDLYNKALRELAREEQVDIGLYNRVGDLYVRVNELDEAVESYEKAVELYREAYLPNNAIAVCKKIIRNVPDHHRAYLVIGQIRAEQGFIPDARTNFLTYAERMQQAGEMDESFRALVEFCDLAPDDVGVRITVAEQMAAQDRTEEAVEQLLIVHRHYVEVGDSEQASEIEARILELDPEADLTAAATVGGFDTSDEGAGDMMSHFGEISLGGDAFGSPSDEEADAGFAISSSMEEAAGDLSSAEAEEEGAEPEGFDIASAADEPDEEEAAEFPTMGFDDDEEGEAVELPMMDFDDDEEEEAVELPMMDLGDDEGGWGEMGAEATDAEAEAREGEAVEEAQAAEESVEEAEEEAVELPTMGFHDEEDEGALTTRDLDSLALDDVSSGAEPEASEALEEAAEEVRSEEPSVPTEPGVPSEEWPAVEPAAEEAPASESTPQEAAPGPPGAEPVPDTTEAQAGPTPPPPTPPAEEAPAAPPETAAPADESPARAGGGDESFIDLGAMILGDDREKKSTRFTVAYEEPSGDEEADFAKMLTQFKDKVSENLDSSDVRAHYDLGTAYKEMGLLDEAVTSFQAALRASADHLPTYELMGQTFIEMGQPEAAVRSLERAVRSANAVEDELVGIYYYLGRAYEELENKESAMDYYDRVFALDINFADVTDRLRELR